MCLIPDHGLWVPPWVQVSPQANLTSHSRLAALRPKGSPESLQGAPSLSPRRILPSKVEREAGGAPLCLKMKRVTPEGRCPNSPERVTGGLTPSLLCFQILLETRAVCSFLSFIYHIALWSCHVHHTNAFHCHSHCAGRSSPLQTVAMGPSLVFWPLACLPLPHLWHSSHPLLTMSLLLCQKPAHI